MSVAAFAVFAAKPLLSPGVGLGIRFLAKKAGHFRRLVPIEKMKTVSSFSPASLRERRPFYWGG